MWNSSASLFRQARTRERAYRLALGMLGCLGRHTITGVLTATGREHLDWTSDYRFFSQARWTPEELFAPVLQSVLELVGSRSPLVVAIDDTNLRKTGTKIPGVSYRRDPMSPPFHTNLVRAQRFCQVSAMVPDLSLKGAARAIPIRFHHAPTPRKPWRTASAEEKREYRRLCRQNSLPLQAAQLLEGVREDLPSAHAGQQLIPVVDGSFCNGPFLKNIPEKTTVIGRIRKDAKLHALPQNQPAVGRRRVYGERLPTPHEIHLDDEIPWTPVKAFAAGRIHTFRVKQIKPVLWRKSGADMHLQLVAIKPLHYRIPGNDHLSYRHPAYLICTDPDLPLEKVIQYYLWRWDIEVNHRDEKQIIGVGQAQVRSPKAVDRVPAFAVAVYATLLLAGIRAQRNGGNVDPLTPPKWRRSKPRSRVPTQALLNHVRTQFWSDAIHSRPLSFSHFASLPIPGANHQKSQLPLESALQHVVN